MSELLRVEHLKKYFNTPAGELRAVDDVSFSVEKGQTVGVVGESGCGKSTLGRAILRLHEPTAGQVYFDGQAVTDLNKRQMKEMRSRMQIIFQDPYSSLNPRMTVSQAIAAPMLIQGKYKKNQKKEIQDEVLRMMDLVGLARRLVNSYPHELDGGRRQRIGIARALALNPDFIVCDEPVSALDVSIQAQVLNLMQDLQEKFNLTYLFITHDLSVVKHLSNYIIVMYLGQIVEVATPDEIFAHPLHPYTQALLSAIPIPDPDIKMNRVILQGELTSPINVGAGCRFAKRCIYACDECANCPVELKEVSPGHKVACTRIHNGQQSLAT